MAPTVTTTTTTETKILEIIQGLFSLGFSIFVHNQNSKTAVLLNATDAAFQGVVSIATGVPPTP